jgi:hypothetical protein
MMHATGFFHKGMASILFEHDLVRKPVAIPDQVRDRLFGIMLLV